MDNDKNKKKLIENLDSFKKMLNLKEDLADNSFKQSDFTLLDFLEKEVARLIQINSFFSEKIINLKNCTQIDHLIAREKEKKAKKIDEITENFLSDDSSSNKRLAGLFKT